MGRHFRVRPFDRDTRSVGRYQDTGRTCLADHHTARRDNVRSGYHL
jgi:hypothetical protein